MIKKLSGVLIATTFIFVFAASASANQQATDIITDILLVRPLSLVATAVGTAAFVITLPFSVPSGNVNDTARKFVADPFNYTFSRPVGDFGRAPYYPAYVDYFSETSGRNTAINPPAVVIIPSPPPESLQTPSDRPFIYPRQEQTRQ